MQSIGLKINNFSAAKKFLERLRSITLRRGMVKVTWPISNFAAPTISLERLKLESLNLAHR